MDDELLRVELADHGVAPDLRAAGKDDVASLVFGGQRVLGALEFQDVTIDEFAAARAAVAGLAAVGETDAGHEQRVENGVAGFGVDLDRRPVDADGNGHVCEAA